MLSPDQKLRCLLIQPRFPDDTFWNYRATCELIGAKTPNMPLGLITVAAILPQSWEFRLVDLNCDELTEADWSWADLVGTGGMLPQQQGTLAVVRESKRRGKFVVVGGADPTSQPALYQEADALVLDEGELTIPLWLDSWRRGEARGTFRTAEKPDMTTSPVPRYDLVKIDDYNQMALQISRGCPFNCEFCDIIELFGRKPRIKNPEQVIRELEAIRATGYSGSVDVVDDNFIGNKRYIKRHILPAMRRWNRIRLRPFFFATEASMNLADDEPLMREMAMAGFRFIFTGIETPDPELLLKTQKTQNTMRPIQDRIRKMLAHGLVPTAGFIMGFDNEKIGMDQSMIACIEDAPISMAMVGLLVALPNTQLTRRLQKEGRLLGFDGKVVGAGTPANATAKVEGSVFEVADQTVAGLNFITTRDRLEILEEYRNVIRSVYAPEAYFGRVLRQASLYRFRRLRVPRPWEVRRDLIGLFRLIRTMTRDPELRPLFWRNIRRTLAMGPNAFDTATRLMAMFIHFRKQRDYILTKTQKLKDLEVRSEAARDTYRPKVASE